MSTKDEKRMDFSTFDRGLVATLRMICVVCFVILFILLCGNVLVRYFPVTTMYWFDEVVEWVFAWMVFLGAAALWARDEHFKLEWISQKLRAHPQGPLVAIVLEILSLSFLLIFAYQSLRLTMLARDWTPVFNISRRYLYACMPVSGVIMVAYSVRNIVRETRVYLNTLRAD
jgi:TRAP-type transport system small permease protein